ncbi:endolytic transglycosylase MltG [Caldicellulosiruptor naganoensis]|uniref:Endolytic murein transglycosylase n=1 Tax=Caldicellulosiruptor naganoensis TaxID=29324 RepID=A0ABY7BE86_9FIRM|nr:endolytic transglycosylase MltG [Caldicellulosiruptor naganoensis]WAM31144.1 endolytic transglycosylase MltG [Caldicellulosiruptor naganoensis]
MKVKNKNVRVYIFIISIITMSVLLLAILLKLQKPKTKEVYVEIPQNTSVKNVAMILKEKGIIKNPYLFMLYVKINNYKIAAGSYKFSSSMSYKELCEALQKGIVFKKTIRFTIPEGFTCVQIAKRLSSLGIVDEKKFLDEINNYNFDFQFKYPSKNVKYKLEGFLYPDTYEIYIGESEKDIIKRMLNRFLEVYNSIKHKKTTQLDDIQTVILASIVEKEAKKDFERPIIAGVFLNRLSQGIKLESCATVEYILPFHKEVLSYEDVKIRSPYNTYLYKGLPPSAVCNPGKESLLAALNPQKTDYLFFVAKKDGSHIFSRTYEEHLKAQKQLKEGKK